MKPGIQTSEFWTTILVHLITVLVTVATVFGKSLDVTGLNALVPTVSFVMSGIAQAWYSHGRSLVKVANASPQATPVPAPPRSSAMP